MFSRSAHLAGCILNASHTPPGAQGGLAGLSAEARRAKAEGVTRHPGASEPAADASQSALRVQAYTKYAFSRRTLPAMALPGTALEGGVTHASCGRIGSGADRNARVGLAAAADRTGCQ